MNLRRTRTTLLALAGLLGCATVAGACSVATPDPKTGARHFVINQVQLGKPELPDQLRVELENNQAASIRATTAAIDKNTAASFPGGIAGYTAYQLQLAIAKAIGAGQVKVVPVPAGSIVSVPGQ